MSPKLILGLGLLVAAASLAPIAVADGVVVSGQCYNADGSQGGKEKLGVTTGDGVIVPRIANVDGGGGAAVEALAMFAIGTIQDGGATGGACDNADDAHRADYLGADVNAAGTNVEVCYSGTVNAGAQNVCSDSPEGAHCNPAGGTNHQCTGGMPSP